MLEEIQLLYLYRKQFFRVEQIPGSSIPDNHKICQNNIETNIGSVHERHEILLRNGGEFIGSEYSPPSVSFRCGI